jgi:hypothetical protein
MIGLLGAAPHIGEMQDRPTLFYLTHFFLYILQTRPVNRFARTTAQTMRINTSKCLFSWDIPPLKFSKGILYVKLESRITFEWREIGEKFKNLSVTSRAQGIER